MITANRYSTLISKKWQFFLQPLKPYWRNHRRVPVLDELIFFVTHKCNFKCRTCFYVKQMDAKSMLGFDELSLDEIVKISSCIGQLSNLLISGGEPFLRDDLARICETFYSQNKVERIHIPTNGFYAEKIFKGVSNILEACPLAEITISLPLDGFQNTHDKIKGIAGSFDKVIATIKSLNALKDTFSNLRLYIISVVNSLNVHEIEKLAEFIKDNLNVDGHGPAPMRGNPYDKSLLPPSCEEWIELSKRLIKFHRYWNKKKSVNKILAYIATNKIKYLYSLYARILAGEALPFKCQAGNIISVLEPNGEVRLCELTQAIGNVRDENYDLKKVLSSSRADEMRSKLTRCSCVHACFLYPSIKMDFISALKANFLG